MVPPHVVNGGAAAGDVMVVEEQLLGYDLV